MLELYDGMVNSPETKLAQGIDATTTTIPVEDLSRLPPPPNIAVIGRTEDAETILYTGVDGNTLTGVTRGFQGQAKPWKAGTPIARRFTEYDWKAIKENFLRHVPRPVYSVRGFGAKGDGVTDDTEAIQAALDTLQDGDALVFPPGVYLTNNLVIPNKARISIFGYGATLKAVSNLNDPDYLIATWNYVNDKTWAGRMIHTIAGLRIDGSNVVTNGIVIQTWRTTLQSLIIENCVNGIKFAAETRNGLKFTTGTMIENRVLNSVIQYCTGKGIWVRDPDRNLATDMYIVDNVIRGGLDIGIYLEASAGTLLQGNHFYGLKTHDVYVSISAMGLRFIGNYLESGDPYCVWFNDWLNIGIPFIGNIVRRGVRVFGHQDGVLLSVGNQYDNPNAFIYADSSSKVDVISVADAFATDQPYRSGANNPGKFYTYGSVSFGIGRDRMLMGKQDAQSMKRTVSYADSPPSTGTYYVGDIVYNTNPGPGQYVGWVCVASGTPGTWKGFGLIES